MKTMSKPQDTSLLQQPDHKRAMNLESARSEALKEMVFRYMEKVWNQGKVDVLYELFTPELAARIEPVILNYRKAFPDWHCMIHEYVTEGDRIMNRWTGRATHLGALFGIPPTGKPIELTGITIHQIQNNKIINEWSEADVLGLLQQLGAVPK